MALRFRILPAPPELRAGWVGGGSSAMAAGPSEERGFEIASDLDELRIGRQPATEIELPFPAVSAVHARMARGELPGAWWVEDLGSINGTWVDGQRLSPRRPVPIRAGQRLRVATVDIVFEGWSATPRGVESTATIARRLISDLFGVVGGEVASLAIESAEGLLPRSSSFPSSASSSASSPASSSTLRLVDRDRRYLAGRANGCDLVLSSEHVSREHAAFVRRWDGVVVFDLGSSNGVLVNGHPIAGDLKLADGDRIDVGPVVLRLTDPEDRYLRRMERLASDPAEKSTVVVAAAPDGNAAESGAAIATPPVVAAVAMRPLGRDVRNVDGAARSPRWPSWVVSALVAAIVVVAIAGLVLLFAAAG